MSVKFQKFLNDESGDFIQWAVLLGILLAIGVPLLIVVGGQLGEILEKIRDFLQQVIDFFEGRQLQMIRELKSFWQDESGAEMVEWVVVTAILLAASVAVLLAIGDRLRELYEEILEQLGGVVTPTH